MGRKNRRATSDSAWLAKQLSLHEMELKDALRAHRTREGISVEQLAAKLGVTPETIHAFEMDDADLTLSQIRHYAYGIECVVEFAVKPFIPEHVRVFDYESDLSPTGHSTSITFTSTVANLQNTAEYGRGYVDGCDDTWEAMSRFESRVDQDA